MGSEALVQKSIIPVDQLEGAAILGQNVRKRHLRFAPHRPPGRSIKLDAAAVAVTRRAHAQHGARVDRHRFNIPHLQPLPRKVFHERLHFPIGHHAFHLGGEFPPKLPLRRQASEFCIRHRGPQKIRQPRRERILVRMRIRYRTLNR